MAETETDPRFPSGKWTGFFLQKEVPGKHRMDLILTFSNGVLTGEGRDRIGEFLVRGRYDITDGRCHWTKRYVGRHDVFYQGFGEGKGIWGTWEIRATPQSLGAKGGFYIWPEGMEEPNGDQLKEEAPLPADADLVSV